MRRPDFASLGGCFDAPQQYFQLSEELSLREGEEIQARQGYPDCEFWSDWDAPVLVKPASEMPVPKIINPICAGTIRLIVNDLVPSAVVTVLDNGIELGQATASETTDVFLVQPLEEGTVQVIESLCGFDISSELGVVTPSGSDDSMLDLESSLRFPAVQFSTSASVATLSKDRVN